MSYERFWSHSFRALLVGALTLLGAQHAHAACPANDYFCSFVSEDGQSNSNVKSTWQLGPKSSSAQNVRIFRGANDSISCGDCSPVKPVSQGGCPQSWNQIATINNTTTSYTDSNATPGLTRAYLLCYDYILVPGGQLQSACQTTGSSGNTYICNSGWRAPPPVPTNLEATDGTYTSKITLDWDGTLPLQAKFQLFRSSLGQLCNAAEAILETSLTNYTDTQVIPGVLYTYSIASKAPNGSLSTCFTENTATGYRKMSPPTNLQATMMDQAWIQVLWNHPNQQPSNGVVKYRLYRKEADSTNVCSSGQQIGTLQGYDTSFNDFSVQAGKTYFYAARSEGEDGYLSDCSGSSGGAGVPGFSISGSVTRSSDGTPLPGISVQVTGQPGVATDANGNYTAANLPSGTFLVSPSAPGMVFAPGNQTVNITNASKTGINFQASCAPGFQFEGASCEPIVMSPIQPLLECVVELPEQAGFIALFRYHSENTGSVEIPVGTSSLGINSFSPAPAAQGQPVIFQPGLSTDAFAVPFSGAPLTWTINAGMTGSLSATASSASPRCAPVHPVATCVSIAEGGLLTAHFGYVNPNPVSIPAAVGPQNFVSPGALDRGQPTIFAPGTVTNAFSVNFPPGTISWNLFGEVASVSPTTTVCAPGNGAPSAHAGIAYSAVCTGALTQVALSALASTDPNGNQLFYSWSTTCENAVLNDPTSATPQLILSGPGMGSAANCSVSVTATDLLASSTATASITVAACQLDCAGVPNGAGIVDQCGICNGDGSTCLDCAGTPFGGKMIDQCGVCGGLNACLDCAGVPFGSSEQDQCGSCNGDGSSCLGCTETNISDLTEVVSDDFFVLRDLTNRALRRLRDVSRSSKKTNKWVRKQLKKYDFRHNKFGLDLYAKLPPTIVSCSNTVLCEQVDNGALLDSYKVFAEELRITGVAAIKKLKPFTAITNTDKKRKKRLKEVTAQVLTRLSVIPRTGSNCAN